MREQIDSLRPRIEGIEYARKDEQREKRRIEGQFIFLVTEKFPKERRFQKNETEPHGIDARKNDLSNHVTA